MTTEEEVRKNTNDIHALTINVTRIATIVETSEKRHDSDMEMMKEAVRGISQLNERIGVTTGMERDITALRDLIAEQKGDLRTIRHDLNNALNALPAVGMVNEKLNEATSTIAAQGAKIEALESWRDKLDGAGGALKGVGAALWGVFGTGITAIGFFIFKAYFSGKDLIGGE